MAEKTASQTQQTAGTPVDAFQKAMSDQFGRYTQMLTESSQVQLRWLEQSNRAIDEMATLMKAGLKYQADLANDFSRIAVDTVKKSTELFPR